MAYCRTTCDVYAPGARLPGAGISGGCSAAASDVPAIAIAIGWLLLLGRARSRSGGGRDRSAKVPPREPSAAA